MTAETLTDTDLRIITLFEQKYFETGRLPTIQQVADLLGMKVSTVLSSLDKQVVKSTLKRRGIEPLNSDGLVSVEQAYLVNILLDTLDKRGVREKLKALKEATGIEITFAQYSAWMKDPNFMRYLNMRAQLVFDSVQPIAKKQLVAAIDSGNLDAIKYYNEMTGVYSARQADMIDLRKIFAQIIDVLTRHCSPDVVLAVASELETIGPDGFNGGRRRELAPVVDTTGDEVGYEYNFQYR